ncbi:hypothetical protein GVAV_001091 [Gurleya vavrai]
MIKNSFINGYKSNEFLNIINGSAGQEANLPVFRNLRKRLGFIEAEEDEIANTDLNISTSTTPVNTNRPSNHTVRIDEEVVNDMEKKGEDRAAGKIETSNNQKFESKNVVEKQEDLELIEKKQKKLFHESKIEAACCAKKILKKPRKSQEIKDENYKKHLEKLAIKNRRFTFNLNSLESKIFFRVLEKISSKKDRINSLDVLSMAKNAIKKYKTLIKFQ